MILNLSNTWLLSPDPGMVALASRAVARPPSYNRESVDHPFNHLPGASYLGGTVPAGVPSGGEGSLGFGIATATETLDLTTGGTLTWTLDFGPGAVNHFVWMALTFGDCTTGITVTDAIWGGTATLPLDLDDDAAGEPELLRRTLGMPHRDDFYPNHLFVALTTGGTYTVNLDVPAGAFPERAGGEIHAAATLWDMANPAPVLVGTSNALQTDLTAS